MKQGDTFPVQISGIAVGNAVVESVGDGKVTLVIPAQRVVMGVRTQLEEPAPEPKDTSGTETIIEGVERSAPVVENNTIDNSTPAPTNVGTTQPVETLQMAEDLATPIEDNTPEAIASHVGDIEADSGAGKTVADATPKNEPLKSPVTITGADGHSYRLPPGTTMEDLMEPAANE